MRILEYWVLRIADSDMSWVGLNWMRPARQSRVGVVYILFSSVLLGLPGIVMGAGLIYLFVGRVEADIWGALLSLALAIELPLHLLFAHYWNRRARQLASKTAA